MMNIIGDIGWLLPPRCAARYTLEVLWKYGIEHITYHDINAEAEPKRIIMNIRNPYTRLRSWLRIWNTTLESPIDSKTYIENLHFQHENTIQFVNKIENPNNKEVPWKYIIPLSSYLKQLKVLGFNQPLSFVSQENLDADLKNEGFEDLDISNDGPFKIHSESTGIRIGFSVTDKERKWAEPGDGMEDITFYDENPECAEIVRLYYAEDFENFGYSLDPGKINV